MGKGVRSERKLFNKLWDAGFMVMRSPASGGGRKHPQPDLLASNGSDIYGIETKRTGQDVVYLKRDEVLKLASFCSRFGFDCEPLVGIRFDRRDWLFARIGDLKPAGNSFKMQKYDMVQKGLKIDDLKCVKNSEHGDDYEKDEN